MNSELEKTIRENLGPIEWVLERIGSETGADGERAERLACELSTMSAAYREALLRWWKDGTVEMDTALHGWSIRRLIDEGKAHHVCQAFAWMDGLSVDPQQTLKLLKVRVDIIVTDPKKFEKLAQYWHDRVMAKAH